MLKRILTVCGIAAVPIALIIVLIISGHSARAFSHHEGPFARPFDKKLDNRIALYVDAYRVMNECLSEAGILPTFKEAKIREDVICFEFFSEERELVAKAIDESCPYPVSLLEIEGHDDALFNPDKDCALVSIYYLGRSGYNKVLVGGSFSGREYDSVYMYYTFRHGAWILLDAGIVDCRPAHGQARDPDRTWYMDEQWKLHKEG